MKKLIRFSIIGIIISILLIIFKEPFYSKLMALFALLIFIFMYYFNHKNEKSHSKKL